MLQSLLLLSMALSTMPLGTLHAVTATRTGHVLQPNCTSVPPVTPGENASLNALTAISENDAWAVGSYQDPQRGGVYPLAEHWDGKAWRVSLIPLTEGWFISTVAVPHSPNVWAVGALFIYLWDGRTWRVEPAPPGGLLTAVAALSTKDAWAVGASHSGNLPSVEHWDGRSWKIVRTPKMHDTSTELDSVVALSATDVWAVGTMYFANQNLPLTEHWDGTRWSVVPSPHPEGAKYTSLYGIASSGGTLFAVGSSDVNGTGIPLVEQWNGSSWQIIAGPQTNASAGFNAVTADASHGIWAAGWTSVIAGQTPLIAHWDGVHWTIASTGSPLYSNFTGIARIPGSDDVWGVGGIDNGTQVLLERCPG